MLTQTKTVRKRSILSKILVGVFLLILMSALFYVYYKAEIIYSGTRDDHYLKYYIISFFGVLFCLTLFWLKENLRTNIAIFILSLFTSLYLAEACLRVFDKNEIKSGQEVAHELGIEFDSRSQFQVVQDFIKDGIAAVPTMHPSAIIFRKEYEIEKEVLLPLGGVSHKTTVYNNESGEYSVYLSDRHGFNNPDSEWDVDRVEWVLVGDSFTHGSALQSGEDIASRIRSLSKKTAINLGMGGNGPLIELAALKEYAEPLRPEIVLWVYCEGNDLVENLWQEKTISVLMKYLEEGFSQGLVDKQNLINEKLEKIITDARVKKFEETTYLIPGWVTLQKIQSLSGLNSHNQVPTKVFIDPLFEDIMRLAKTRAEAWGGKLYFVYLPEFLRYSNQVDHNLYRKKSEVISLIESLSIPVIDIHEEVFSDHPDPLSLFPFRSPGHYTAEGYHQVTESIVENVRQR